MRKRGEKVRMYWKEEGETIVGTGLLIVMLHGACPFGGAMVHIDALWKPGDTHVRLCLPPPP